MTKEKERKAKKKQQQIAFKKRIKEIPHWQNLWRFGQELVERHFN